MGLFDYQLIQLKDYGLGVHKQVDDYQYGGGSGMVMMCEPLHNVFPILNLLRTTMKSSS